MELNLFVKELFSKAQEEGFSEYEVYYVEGKFKYKCL